MSDIALAQRHYKVQRLKRLIANKSYRKAEQRFVIEGVNLLSAAIDAKAGIESVFYDPSARDNSECLSPLLALEESGIRCYELKPGVMDKVADAVTPQPICAIVEMKETHIDYLKTFLSPEEASHSVILVAVDIRDPGNLGTLYRIADAASVSAVVTTKGCVDPFSPKTIRSSAGSVFNVDLVPEVDIEELVVFLKKYSFSMVAADAGDGNDYTKYDYKYPLALFFGNESHGLGETLLESCDASVKILMGGKAESLNVAMAAAVICFEIKRRQDI